MKKIASQTINRPIIVQNNVKKMENNLIKIDLGLDKILQVLIKLFRVQ